MPPPETAEDMELDRMAMAHRRALRRRAKDKEEEAGDE